ncbi:MAG TPA: hypothetical protein VF591_04985 [Pyrinomonadaceae bacterium]|jgi:hypothetical protein
MRDITKSSTINCCLLALLALAPASCRQGAGGGAPPTTAPALRLAGAHETGVPPPSSPASTLRVWRDFSKSADEKTLARIAEELADAVMLHKEQIIGVEVVRFANANGSVWSELPEKFIWGPAPEVPGFSPDLSKAPADAKLFKDAMEKYVQGERLKYEEGRALLLSEYTARVEGQLKRFRDYLLQGPAVGAPCTHFAPLAERMRAENLPYSVLITDGWADCPGERGRAPGGVELRGRHAVIQLTRHADSQADDGEFLRRSAFLRGLFPASEVVPASVPTRAIEFIFQ